MGFYPFPHPVAPLNWYFGSSARCRCARRGARDSSPFTAPNGRGEISTPGSRPGFKPPTKIQALDKLNCRESVRRLTEQPGGLSARALLGLSGTILFGSPALHRATFGQGVKSKLYPGTIEKPPVFTLGAILCISGPPVTTYR